MKEKELREHATCSLCKRGIGHTSVPLFWTVKIERHAVLLDAVRRQDGLAMQLGGHQALANVFSRDEDMTEQMFESELTLCEDCALKSDLIFKVFPD